LDRVYYRSQFVVLLKALRREVETIDGIDEEARRKILSIIDNYINTLEDKVITEVLEEVFR